MKHTRKPPSAIQEQLIAALLPDAHAEPPPPQATPLPALPSPRLPVPAGADGLLVGMARLDRSGRLHERRLLHALGWTAGQRLILDVVHNLIVVQPAPTGSHLFDHRGALHLPATARRMCGIAGPPVVLAASIPEQILVIQSTAVVARLLATHYADVLGGRHER